MILHAFDITPFTAKPSLDYWAVHAETLTPLRIHTPTNGNLMIQILTPPRSEYAEFKSHPHCYYDAKAIAKEVFNDIKQHLIPSITRNHFAHRALPSKNFALPEHLLVFDGAGEHPAIFRTQFPRIIIPAEPGDEEILGTPSHWIAREDLTALGWEYYWTGCQQALEELAPAFIAGTASLK